MYLACHAKVAIQVVVKEPCVDGVELLLRRREIGEGKRTPRRPALPAHARAQIFRTAGPPATCQAVLSREGKRSDAGGTSRSASVNGMRAGIPRDSPDARVVGLAARPSGAARHGHAEDGHRGSTHGRASVLSASDASTNTDMPRALDDGAQDCERWQALVGRSILGRWSCGCRRDSRCRERCG